MALKQQRLFLNRRGNAMAIMAGVMPMLIGAAAIGVDAVQWSLSRRQIQRIADSAAMAGAHAIVWKNNVKAAAERDLQLNNQVPLSASPVIQNPPTSGPYAGDQKAVRVVLVTAPDLPFIRYFVPGQKLATAEATARVTNDQRYCVIALDQSAAPGIEFAGNSVINFQCGFFSNSTANGAVATGGVSASVTASAIGAAGTVVGNYKSPTQIYANEPKMDDPYSTLPPANSYANNCQAAISISASQTQTVSPGCYNGFSSSGQVTMSPGVYVINNASFSVSGGSLIGSGVTIILTGGAPKDIGVIDLSGQAYINLAPPSSGTFAGVLVYQDSRAQVTAQNTLKIAGGSNSRLQGAFYAPKGRVSITGNSTLDLNCFRTVSQTVYISGNSGSSNSCPLGSAYSLYGVRVRLVG